MMSWRREDDRVHLGGESAVCIVSEMIGEVMLGANEAIGVGSEIDLLMFVQCSE